MKTIKRITAFLFFVSFISTFSFAVDLKKFGSAKPATSTNRNATPPSNSFTESETDMKSLPKSEQQKLSEVKTKLSNGGAGKSAGKASTQKISLSGGNTTNGETHLTVRANITGASVYVDGNFAGKTPVTIKQISAGSHTVKVEAQGYETATSAAYVTKGKSNFCYVVLEKNKGFLNISTNVHDCLYYCDGVRLLTNPAAIPEGVHVIKVRKFGYRDFEAPVNITAFRVKNIYVSLSEAPFEVTQLTADRNAFNPNYKGGLGKCVITASVTNKGSGETVIKDMNGAVVARKKFPEFTTWDQVFTWNGRGKEGQALPAGDYKITFTSGEYSLSVTTKIDYTLTYYLFDFADGGLGVGTVPVALSVPEKAVYVGATGRAIFNTTGFCSNLPVGMAFAYAPFKGFDIDFKLDFFPTKESKVIVASDGAEQEIPMFLAGGSARYAGKLLSIGSFSLNLGGTVGYGYSEVKVYPPYGIADGRGLNAGLMLGADMSKLFVGFTSQMFFGAETSDPTAGDNTLKNSLAVMFKPLPEIALNAWGALHSVYGYYVPRTAAQGGSFVEKETDAIRALELGAEASFMIPATSLVVSAGGMFYCYPRRKMYYGAKLDIKYVF